MPDELDYGEVERWHDPVLAEVHRLVMERTGETGVAPWRLPRLHGRYAAG